MKTRNPDSRSIKYGDRVGGGRVISRNHTKNGNVTVESRSGKVKSMTPYDRVFRTPLGSKGNKYTGGC